MWRDISLGRGVNDKLGTSKDVRHPSLSGKLKPQTDITRYRQTPVRTANTKISERATGWKGWGRTLVECTTRSPFSNTVWQSLERPNIHLPWDPDPAGWPWAFITEKWKLTSVQKPVRDCHSTFIYNSLKLENKDVPPWANTSTPRLVQTTERGSAAQGVHCWCASRLDGSQGSEWRSQSQKVTYRMIPLQNIPRQPVLGLEQVGAAG